MKRFVVIRVDVTRSDSPGARLKNEAFKARSIPFMAFYPSDDVGRKDDWYNPNRTVDGSMKTEAFLARLRATR